MSRFVALTYCAVHASLITKYTSLLGVTKLYQSINVLLTFNNTKLPTDSL
jgi:hypothetical protein